MNEIRKRLEEQIKALEYELKVELPKEIKRAREHGDLRENAEYHAAKERQSFVDARVNQLKHRVAALSMANLDKIPRDKVGLGSTVHLREVDSGEEVVYEIVTPEEADPGAGRISPSSPIGRSLIGKAEGDEVEVRAPSGVREYELLRLQTMYDQVEESAGDS
jgi:transcription elongation factor GreA